MNVVVTVEVPHFIYEIYATAAKELKDYSTEQVMSGALQAYAQHLFDEMKANGDLP